MMVWGEVHAQGHPSLGGECGIESTPSKVGPDSYSVSPVVHTLSGCSLFVLCVFVVSPACSLEGGHETGTWKSQQIFVDNE